MRLSDFEQRKLDADYSSHMDAHTRDKHRAAAAMIFEAALMLSPTISAQLGFRRQMDSLSGIDSFTKAEALISSLLPGLRENIWPEP